MRRRAIPGAGVLFFAACGAADPGMPAVLWNCGHTTDMQNSTNIPKLAAAVGIAPRRSGTDHATDELAAWRLET